MSLIIADRVLEASTTTGTGVFTLTGASLGFRSFASVCAVADTVWYYIEGVNSFGVPTGEYEYGLGTYSAANQLTRTTVRGSSNGGSAVNFTAGTKLVGISPMAPFDSATKLEWRNLIGVGEVSALTALVSINGGPLAGFRNKVINGDFSQWQRGTSGVGVAGGFAYLAVDQWYTNCVGGITATVARTKTPAGSEIVYGRFFPTFAFSGTAASGSNVGHRIENGATMLSGKTVTLSFYAADSVATSLQIVLRQNFGTGGAPSASVDTTPAAVTVAPTFGGRVSITVTLPTIVGKTLGTNWDDYLDIIFIPTVANAHTLTLAAVQLEIGTVATDFEFRSAATELALCQRYLFTLNGGYSGFANGSTIAEFAVTFPVTMRAAGTLVPTATLHTISWIGASGLNPSSVSLTMMTVGLTGCTFRANNFTGLAAGQCLVGVATASNYAYVTAEL